MLLRAAKDFNIDLQKSYMVGDSESDILAGKADFIYDDGTETVEAGGCHYCPKGHGHSMINNGTDDIVFFAVVPEQ